VDARKLRDRSCVVLAALLCAALITAGPASAQKKGGTLRLYHNDNPPSTSLLEESTIASVMPFAAVFNNLVTFDPAKVHESIETVIPDLAESWAWDPTNTRLTFKLRQGVKWHDGQPFTAKDVQCTWRMLIGKAETQDFKRNPRKVWYTKLKDVSINGDFEATFELSEPQPSLPVLLASAFSAVYPCHVPQQVMGRSRWAPVRSNSSSSSAAIRSASSAIRIISGRTGPISTRSRCAPSIAAPRACLRSRPAITTSPFLPTSAFP
jgi:peptide/nickel transport system substrate-binding protein